MSAEDAVKGSWIRDNGIFDPAAFVTEHQNHSSSRTLQRGAADSGEETVRLTTTSIPDSLHGYWKLATQSLQESSLSSEQSNKRDVWWDRLIRSYSEDTRHYHTTVHLWEMIQYWDLLQLAKNNTDAPIKPLKESKADDVDVVLLLSIFFHDAVYDCKSGSNEEDSVRLFESFAEELSLPWPIRTAVVDYIIATKNHQITAIDTSEDASALSKSLALFLDLDMAVLGKTPMAYSQYAALIRREYSFVPHDEYCRKRADVLETFLMQPRIYATEDLYQALEQSARTNLRNEIDSLRRGMIPDITAITSNEPEVRT